jgi:O-antigen/teichoic acid export membrane protein
MTELRGKALGAARWSALDVAMRQGAQFLVTIVLARILTPEDFGMVAMLALFTGMAAIFIDAGFSAALIQRQTVSRTDESTVFFFNLAMGTVTALLLCAGADMISAFFNQQALQYLTYAMAFNIFLSAFGSIHSALLNKAMDFRTLTKVGGVSSALSGLVAIFMAVQGYGVWSLAGQAITASMLTVMLLWRWHPWRPDWAFSTKSLRSLFRFGGYEMAATLTDVLSNNLYLILIGKIYSVREAGLYDRAQRTQQLPVTLMMSVINRVAFSAYSSVAMEKERLARGLRQAQALTMFLNLPLLVGVILLAEPLVQTLFGSQWGACVPVLQVLGLSGLLWPMHVLNLNVLRAQGRADLFFRITLFKKVFAIGLTVVAAFYGVMAVAWAQVAISFFAYFVNTHYTSTLLGYGGWRQMRDLAMNFTSVIPLACVVYLTTHAVESSPLIELVVASFAGGVAYWLTCRWICAAPLNEFMDMAGLRKSRKSA